MSFCNQLSINCDECFESDFEKCSSLTITTSNLIEGTSYNLNIVDKFENIYSTVVTIGNEGDFIINSNDFEKKIFEVSGNKIEVYLSQIKYGFIPIPMTIDGNDYNCIILTII